MWKHTQDYFSSTFFKLAHLESGCRDNSSDWYASRAMRRVIISFCLRLMYTSTWISLLLIYFSRTNNKMLCDVRDTNVPSDLLVSYITAQCHGNNFIDMDNKNVVWNVKEFTISDDCATCQLNKTLKDTFPTPRARFAPGFASYCKIVPGYKFNHLMRWVIALGPHVIRVVDGTNQAPYRNVIMNCHS